MEAMSICYTVYGRYARHHMSEMVVSIRAKQKLKVSYLESWLAHCGGRG